MNKRGQFFLMAAIIIIAIVVGLAGIVNSVEVGSDQEAFSDQTREIKDETKQVLDYGVYNNEMSISDLVEDVLLEYEDYIAYQQGIFIFGDVDNVDALYFELNQDGIIGINTGSVDSTLTVTDLVGRMAEVERLDSDTVRVSIDGINYDFDLRDGLNFYVVIIKHVGEGDAGEKFVETAG